MARPRKYTNDASRKDAAKEAKKRYEQKKKYEPVINAGVNSADRIAGKGWPFGGSRLPPVETLN
jgi:hypothetical protein